VSAEAGPTSSRPDAVQSAAPRAIVLIHGVGNPPPGEFLEGWIAGFQRRDRASWTRSSIVLDRTHYETAHCTSPAAGHTMFEVNWADLQRPLSGIAGIFRHIAQLSIATVRIGTEPSELGATPRPFARAYAWAFFGLVWWSFVPAIVFMLARCTETASIRVTIAVVAALVMSAVTWWLSRYASQLRLGYAWAAGVLALDISRSLKLVSVDDAVALTAMVYVLSQVVMALLLIAAAIERFRDPGLTDDQRFAHLALLWMPYAVLSAVASIAWSVSVSATRLVPGYDLNLYPEWATAFAGGLRYDLRLVEHVTTVAVLLIGVAALLVVLACFRPPRGVPAGLHAQNAFALWLRVSPAILVGAGIGFLASLIWGSRTPLDSTNTVAGIFGYSTLRPLPFLLFFLVPQLRPIVDVIGDVAFYLTPGRLSIRDEAVRRVRRLVEDVAERGLGGLVLVGFSQGAVLGRVGLAESAVQPATLATVGCPIGSLYARFLGWKPAPPLDEGVRWWNAFHEGDFIAGPIPDGAENAPLGPGAHDRYERDEPVLDVVFGGAEGGGG